MQVSTNLQIFVEFEITRVFGGTNSSSFLRSHVESNILPVGL